jgi:hypothetical protein
MASLTLLSTVNNAELACIRGTRSTGLENFAKLPKPTKPEGSGYTRVRPGG